MAIHICYAREWKTNSVIILILPFRKYLCVIGENLKNRSVIFFSNATDSQEIERAMAEKFGEILGQIQSAYTNPENTQRFDHGGPLRRPSSSTYFDGEIKTHSSLHEIRFQDIAEHDVSILRRELESFKATMNEQFIRSVYTTLADSCDSVGNVVDAQVEGSTLGALEAMWEKLDIQVSPDGIPKLPEIHVGADAYDKFKTALESASPEYEARIEKIKLRKITEGWERELQRQARFVGYGKKI